MTSSSAASALTAPPVSLGVPGGHLLVVGDSSKAHLTLPGLVGKVSLVVTSPPYHNAISYTNHAADEASDWRERSMLAYAAEYHATLDPIWESCLTLLRPGGYLALNAGTVLESGHHYPLPQDLLMRLTDAGWEYVRTILWNKVTAGVKRAGSVIKHQLPGYWYPNIMTEHILVLKKPGPLRAPNAGVPEAWLQPVWEVAPVPPRRLNHPAPYPEELPHRFVRMLTEPGEWVFDPFLGVGSTAKAAADLGRRAAGFDLEVGYVAEAAKRLFGPGMIRPEQLSIEVMPEAEFEPGKSRGKTRHGAGKQTVRPVKVAKDAAGPEAANGTDTTGTEPSGAMA